MVIRGHPGNGYKNQEKVSVLIKILPPSGLGAGAENVTVNEEKDDVSDNGTGVVKEYRFLKFGEMQNPVVSTVPITDDGPAA